MAQKEEMTLQMKVLAETARARRELSQFKGWMGTTFRGTGRLFEFGGRLGGGLLRNGRRLMLGLGLATTVAAGAALNAAGDYESLETRLHAVMGTAEQASRAFDQTKRKAGSTPFRLDDLVEGRIILEGLGVKGPRALDAVGDAAASMGRSVADTAALVAGLEAEPLRRLGIQLKSESGKFTFQFRDRMGELKKIAADGAEAARGTLLGIFQTKFGGATGRLAGTLKGMTSTLQDNIKEALAQFGEGASPAFKRILGTATLDLRELIDSGKLEEMGKKFGEFVEQAFLFVRDVIKEIPKVAKDLQEKFKNAPEQFAESMTKIMGTAGKILVDTVVGLLSASSDIFAGIGKVIAGGLLQVLIDSGVPGVEGPLKGRAMQEVARQRSAAQAEVERLSAEGLGPGNADFDAALDELNFLGAITKRNITTREVIKYSGGGPELMREGVNQVAGAFPKLAEQARETMAATTGAIFNKPRAPNIDHLKADQQATSQMYRSRGMAAFDRMETMYAGDFGASRMPAGIRVENMRVAADKPAAMASAIMRAAGSPRIRRGGR